MCADVIDIRADPLPGLTCILISFVRSPSIKRYVNVAKFPGLPCFTHGSIWRIIEEFQQFIVEKVNKGQFSYCLLELFILGELWFLLKNYSNASNFANYLINDWMTLWFCQIQPRRRIVEIERKKTECSAIIITCKSDLHVYGTYCDGTLANP